MVINLRANGVSLKRISNNTSTYFCVVENDQVAQSHSISLRQVEIFGDSRTSRLAGNRTIHHKSKDLVDTSRRKDQGTRTQDRHSVAFSSPKFTCQLGFHCTCTLHVNFARTRWIFADFTPIAVINFVPCNATGRSFATKRSRRRHAVET